MSVRLLMIAIIGLLIVADAYSQDATISRTRNALAVGEHDDAEIARLVKQLGSSDFRMRESATKRLKEIGEPALDALHEAASSKDAEAHRRAEKILRVIETELYAEQVRFTGHHDQVWDVTVSADGKRVLTSSNDRTMRLWDADTGKELHSFVCSHRRTIAPALSPDGQLILSASGDGQGNSIHIVHLWDVATGKELQKMIGHTQWVRSVAFGHEGTAISGSNDRSVRLWDLKTGKTTAVFTNTADTEGVGNIVCSVAYSNQAKLAATGLEDASIRLWNLETGKEVRKLTGHSQAIMSGGLCFSPDGKRLLSLSAGTEFRIWDVQSGKVLQEMRAAHKPTRLAFCAALSPNGKRLISGGYDNLIRVFDTATAKELRPYDGHTDYVHGLAFFPDGKRIVSASKDGTARIWRAPR